MLRISKQSVDPCAAKLSLDEKLGCLAGSKDLYTEEKNWQLLWKIMEDRVRPREAKSHLHFLYAALSAAKARDVAKCGQRIVQCSGRGVPEETTAAAEPENA